MRFSPALLMFLLGCEFQSAVPSGALLTCGSERDCPDGATCASALQRCVPVSDDRLAPSLSGAVVDPPFARAGSTVTARFDVDEAQGIAPQVLAAGPAELSLLSADAELVFATVITDETPEGGYTVTARLVDASGNVAERVPVGTFEVDRTPPGLVQGTARVSVVSQAPTQNAVASLGPLGRVDLEVVIDEDVLDPPTLRSEPPGLTVSNVTLSGRLLRAQVTAETGAADGTARLVVDLVDRAGNTASAQLGVVVVDQSAPAGLDVESECLRLVRRPWGADETGGAVLSTLSLGSLCLLSEATGTVVVADEANAIVLASASVVDHRFGDIELRVPDVATVAVRLVDDAGNAGPALLVKNLEWVATLGGKIFGSATPNPHRVDARAVHTVSLAQASSIEQAAFAVERTDSLTLDVDGAAFWVQRTRDGPVSTGLFAEYDPGRGRLIGFSGDGVFEWSGRRWGPVVVTDPEGDGQPVDLDFTAKTYDPIRDRIVLFAGPSIVQNETWSWNGTSFRRLDSNPACPAPPRFGAALEWHPQLARAVLIGGGLGTTELAAAMFNDDDGCWEPMPGSTAAIADRLGPALVADDANGRIVMFSGASDNDTWAHDGFTWTQIPGPGPPGQLAPAMALDPADPSRILVSTMDELWALAGTTWTPLSPAPPDVAGRGLRSFAVDGARDVLVITGGVGPTSEWNGAGFVAVDHAPQPHTISVNRLGAAAVDTAFGLLVVDGGGPSNRTLAWPGVEWLDLAAAPAPSLQDSSAFFDGLRVVVYGGDSATQAFDTTVFFENGAWVPQSVPGPPPRSSAVVAWDDEPEGVVLFGGLSGNPVPGQLRPLFGDTWRWTPATATWTRLFATDERTDDPSPRHAATMALDPVSGEILLTGGIAGTLAAFDDTWLFDGSRWLDVTPLNTEDRARPDASAIVDNQTGRVTLLGGTAGPPGSVLEWDGLVWRRRDAVNVEGNGTPLPRNAPLLAHEPGGGRVVFTGGFTNTILGPFALDDGLWAWDSGSATHPSILVDIDLAAAQIPANAVVAAIEVRAVAAGTSAAGSGARLSWWRAGRFETLASHVAAGLSPLVARTADDAPIASLRQHRSGHLFIVVEPAGDNGRDIARVSLDSLEVRVTYRR